MDNKIYLVLNAPLTQARKENLFTSSPYRLVPAPIVLKTDMAVCDDTDFADWAIVGVILAGS